jgi:hypothetical protein
VESGRRVVVSERCFRRSRLPTLSCVGGDQSCGTSARQATGTTALRLLVVQGFHARADPQVILALLDANQLASSLNETAAERLRVTTTRLRSDQP